MIQFRMQPSNYYAEVFGVVIAAVKIGMYFVILCITTTAVAVEASLFQCVRV